MESLQSLFFLLFLFCIEWIMKSGSAFVSTPSTHTLYACLQYPINVTQHAIRHHRQHRSPSSLNCIRFFAREYFSMFWPFLLAFASKRFVNEVTNEGFHASTEPSRFIIQINEFIELFCPSWLLPSPQMILCARWKTSTYDGHIKIISNLGEAHKPRSREDDCATWGNLPELESTQEAENSNLFEVKSRAKAFKLEVWITFWGFSSLLAEMLADYSGFNAGRLRDSLERFQC